MAVEFFVEQADRSPQSGLANEEIYAGELVNDAGSGVDLLAFGDSGENAALARYDGQSFARNFDDEVREPKYDPNDDQRNRVQYQRFESGALFRVRTIDDDSATAPSISHRSVVGIVDEGTGDAPSAPEGRVVEEGYTNGTTTYERGNSNFKAIGVAYRPARQTGGVMDEYDYPVRVEMFDGLEA